MNVSQAGIDHIRTAAQEHVAGAMTVLVGHAISRHSSGAAGCGIGSSGPAPNFKMCCWDYPLSLHDALPIWRQTSYVYNALSNPCRAAAAKKSKKVVLRALAWPF